MTRLSEQPEIKLFGKERFQEGYKTGYQKSTLDRRKRLSLKEKSISKQFGVFFDYLGDRIFDNKKR